MALEQLNNLPLGIEIYNLGQNFVRFFDTAAAVENLDLAMILLILLFRIYPVHWERILMFYRKIR